MARDDEDPSVDARVNRSVRRLLKSVLLVIVVLTAVGGWAYSGFVGSNYLGFYQLRPGQSAVVLRLGAYERTESREGLRWHLPYPIETVDIVNILSVNDYRFSTEMLTADEQYVLIDMVVQYRRTDPVGRRSGQGSAKGDRKSRRRCRRKGQGDLEGHR